MDLPGPLQLFLSDLDPGTKLLVKGPFGPKIYIFCNFFLCAWNIYNWSHYMGVYGLGWTPAIIFETI